MTKPRKPHLDIKNITDAELEGLRIPVRNALVAHVMNGLKYEDVASDQGIPVGTVKSRINRALTKIATAREAAHEKAAQARTAA